MRNIKSFLNILLYNINGFPLKNVHVSNISFLSLFPPLSLPLLVSSSPSSPRLPLVSLPPSCFSSSFPPPIFSPTLICCCCSALTLAALLASLLQVDAEGTFHLDLILRLTLQLSLLPPFPPITLLIRFRRGGGGGGSNEL